MQFCANYLLMHSSYWIIHVRALLNSGSLLFSRIRIVALNVKVMSLSSITVNVVILDLHSCSVGGVGLEDRLPCRELRERLRVDDIALVLRQNRLRWYGHVLRKDDDDWVKKCMDCEVEGPVPGEDQGGPGGSLLSVY